MKTKKKILSIGRTKKVIKTSDLTTKLGLSRQALSAHLADLVREGSLVKEGSTRNATYRLASSKKPTHHVVTLVKKTQGLQEDLVFDELEKRLNLKQNLNKNAQAAAFYAFTEMLNNAIDHSRSPKVQVSARVKDGVFSFEVKDYGVGIFANVQRKFKLEDEFVAAEHVLKGKQTTAPERHSGQGIFFTSRIADFYSLKSHSLEVDFDNNKKDVFFRTIKNQKGTLVVFSISAQTKKKLDALFREYSNEEFEFDRNEIRVKLTARETFVSRSQARRLLAGLEDFERITFDFKGVDGVGQGFIDEIFRVYTNRYPEKRIDFINANDAVHFMIRRAMRS